MQQITLKQPSDMASSYEIFLLLLPLSLKQ